MVRRARAALGGEPNDPRCSGTVTGGAKVQAESRATPVATHANSGPKIEFHCGLPGVAG